MKLINNQAKYSQYYSNIDNINKYNIFTLNKVPKISALCLEVFLKDDLIKYFLKTLGLNFILYTLLLQFPFIKKSKINSLDEDKKYLLRINISNVNQIYSFLNLIFLEKFKITNLEFSNKVFLWLPIQNLILSQSLQNLLQNKMMISTSMLSRINIHILTSNLVNSSNKIKNLPLLWFNKKIRTKII